MSNTLPYPRPDDDQQLRMDEERHERRYALAVRMIDAGQPSS